MRGHYGALFRAALIVFIPVSAIDVLADVFRGVQVDRSGLTADQLPLLGATLAGALLLALGSQVGEQFYNGFVTGVAVSWRRGERHPSLIAVLRHLPFGRLVAADMVFSTIIAVGLLVFLLPGALLFTWFVLAAPLIEIERCGLVEAFRRSRQLVRGNFFRVALAIIPLSLAIDIPAEAVQSIDLSGTVATYLLHWALTTLVSVLTAPFYALAAALTTHELLVQKGHWETPPLANPRAAQSTVCGPR